MTDTAKYTEDQLRFALAMNRGIQMLDPSTERGKKVSDEFAKLFTPTANHTTSPDGVLYHIHQGLFEDWRQRDPQCVLTATVSDSTKRGKVSEILKDFLWNAETGLLDKNNYPASLHPDGLERKLANFHQTIAQLSPFSYGNRLTAEFFLTALFDQAIMKELYPQGIDFRRLTAEDRNILRNPKSSAEEMLNAFRHAMDAELTPKLSNTRNSFGTWNESKTEISGIPFLAYQEGDQTYVVTVNGGLVPKEKVETAMIKHRANDALMADFPPLQAEKFLQDIVEETPQNKEVLAKLREFRARESIDGIPITEKNAAPLCCLDINILTGLRPTSNTRLEALFKEVAPSLKFPFDLAGDDNLRDQMQAAAGEGTRLARSVEIAYERISYLKPQMEKARDGVFADKSPSNTLEFMMSMGGGGSGKTAAKDVISAATDGNFVEASLDAFRSYSDLYTLLLAADHHADDYTLVQGIAGNLRDWVKDKALEEKYNLLYDGTGIDYAGRYDKITAEFKKNGYNTRLCAVDSSMPDAIRNVKGRYDREGRALLWPVVTGKHANFPDSFTAAVADKNLDHVMLFANDKGYKEHHLVAETHIMPPAEFASLTTAKKEGTLTATFENLQQKERASLPLLKDKDEGYHHRKPAMQEDNLSFLRYGDVKESRVLAIYQADRFTQMLEKGQMNKAASSPENLGKLPRAMRFSVIPQRQQNGVGIGG